MVAPLSIQWLFRTWQSEIQSERWYPTAALKSFWSLPVVHWDKYNRRATSNWFWHNTHSYIISATHNEHIGDPSELVNSLIRAPSNKSAYDNNKYCENTAEQTTPVRTCENPLKTLCQMVRNDYKKTHNNNRQFCRKPWCNVGFDDIDQKAWVTIFVSLSKVTKPVVLYGYRLTVFASRVIGFRKQGHDLLDARRSIFCCVNRSHVGLNGYRKIKASGNKSGR